MLRPWEIHFQVDLQNTKAVYLQIADTIIQAIKQGKLRPQDALPGSRNLAKQIGVNRNTVVKALDVLVAEGWLQSSERKGFFVSDMSADTLASAEKSRVIKKASQSTKTETKVKISFDDGLPNSKIVPFKELARAYRQIFNQRSRWQMTGYGDAQGDIKFRRAIMTMLNHKRGLTFDTTQLCITRGSQMALYLMAHCLITNGEAVLIENPGYKPAWNAFRSAGAELLPVSMEKDGVMVSQIRKYLEQGKKVRAIYTTPHHHFPTTVSLSLSKRLELIQLSNEYGFHIIEDDYDHEFHFGARPLLPMGSLQTIHNYVYIGTLSKIVSPSLRVGYVASETSLIEKVVNLRKIIDVQGDHIMEQAVLQLIEDGSIKKHLTRATQYYHKKRDWFEHIIQQKLGQKVDYNKPNGGLAFWIVPKGETDMYQLSQKLLQKGVEILTPEKFSFDQPVKGIRLGYASLAESQLSEGIDILADLL